MQPSIVLASSSPRRRQLLRYLDLPFTVDPSGIDETPTPGIRPVDLAVWLATGKAVEVASRHPDEVVIGADTLVDLDGLILNKPSDAADAERMLGLLAGRTHLVHSGLCVWRGGISRTRLVSATVTMHAASVGQIADYVATGEPLDKAGAYAVQGLGARLVAGVEGSYLAVVGLPLLGLRDLLLQAGVGVGVPTPLLEALDRGEGDQPVSDAGPGR